MVTEIVDLDLGSNSSFKIVTMEGDIRSRFIEFHLSYNGEVFNLQNKSVKCRYVNGRTTEEVNLVINDRVNGVCTLKIPYAITSSAQNRKCELVISQSGEILSTIPFSVEVAKSLVERAPVESSNEFGALNNALWRIDGINAELNNINSQLDTNKNRIEEVASTGTTAEVVQNKVSEMAQNGSITFNTVNNDMTTFMKKTNLFNPESTLVDKIPKWIGYNSDLTNDENTTVSSNYLTSNIVKCKQGEQYIYYGDHYGANVYYADSTKTLTKVVEVNSNTPFTIPLNMEYYRIVFTYNSDEMNNNKWKDKIVIAKGNSLENISPYGKNEVIDLLLPNEIVQENHLSQTLKDKINGINTENSTLLIPKGASYSEGEAILLLNFDGWNQNTFDVIAPYLKEKGIPFTLFFTGYDKGTGINPNDLRNYAKEMGKKFEMAMYTGQPSSTMNSTTNFKEQMAQIKASYDGIINYGLPRPKVCSYAGGIKTELTEFICQNVFGQKIGRTTENSKIVNPITTTFSIPCSGYGDDGTYTISVVDSIVVNKQHRAVMTHNILNGTDVTDTSYNMRERYLKAWIDKIAEKVNNGSLKCMTFYEYYLYTILPHSSSIGQHALVWENDNRQHEYVYTENGWVELTNFQSYN